MPSMSPSPWTAIGPRRVWTAGHYARSLSGRMSGLWETMRKEFLTVSEGKKKVQVACTSIHLPEEPSDFCNKLRLGLRLSDIGARPRLNACVGIDSGFKIGMDHDLDGR